MKTTCLRWAAILSLTSLIGCAVMREPIIGDWQGYQPLSTPQGQVAIELVLYGRPGGKSGKLRLSSQDTMDRSQCCRQLCLS
ncbi:MAG: hypothetical protein AAYR33_10495 [Acetobacteraceae bacterium]